MLVGYEGRPPGKHFAFVACTWCRRHLANPGSRWNGR